MMNLKKLIKETVLRDNVNSTKSDLKSIKEAIFNQMIVEGVDDPGILKCVFMAGGPGSGKSYVSMEIFGVDKEYIASFSDTGLKVVNSDSAFEALLKKNGINPKDLAKIEAENPELWNDITGHKNSIRNQAKQITAKQKSFYEEGRLGMIIDGTGHDYPKIEKLKKHAEELGYDTYMVFVNTTLKVAQERNKSRERILPDDLVAKTWTAVQSNLGKFKNLFGGNFEIVDNTSYDSYEYKYTDKKTGTVSGVTRPIAPEVRKATQRFISAPNRNPIGKQWITTARLLKKSNLIK